MSRFDRLIVPSRIILKFPDEFLILVFEVSEAKLLEELFKS